MKRTGLLMSSIALAATISSVSAFSLTHEQSQELRRHGTVTVYDKATGQKTGHYEISFMPGQENIVKDGGNHWIAAGKLMDELIREDFWKDKVYRRFKDGISVMKDGVTNGVGAIPTQFKEMIELDRKAKGQFGHLARVAFNAIKFSGKVIGDVFRTIGEGTVGVIYTVVAPTGTILYRPIAAATEAIAAGTLWPVARFTWNGAAWAATANSHEPTGHGDMFVTFVPEHMPASSHAASSHDEGSAHDEAAHDADLVRAEATLEKLEITE